MKGWKGFLMGTALFGLFFSLLAILGSHSNDSKTTRVETTASNTQSLEIPINSYEEKIFLVPLEKYLNTDELSSQAIYIEYRDTSGRYPLLTKDGEQPRPLASLTKTMTAITALQYSDIVENIAVTSDAISQEGDQGLRDGQQWPLDTALALMMQSSSNDMAYAVQETVSKRITQQGPGKGVVNIFVKEMNRQADLIGLADTFFVDAIGFDASEQLSGSYGTPRDVASILWQVMDLYPEIARASIVSKAQYSNNGDEIIINNTNPILSDYPEIVFSKTGFTDLAGGNLALVATTPKAETVAIVLLGSTFEGRFSDAKKILASVKQWSEIAL